ncbi:MAG: DUF3307 domain-containing protein [Flavobacteriales bacterium]
METLFLVKLILAHLLGDFILQSKRTVEHKKAKKVASIHLYLHGLIHGALVWILLFEWHYWWAALYVFVVHILIDALKLYLDRREKLHWFVLDQFLHIASLIMLWLFVNDVSVLCQYTLNFPNEQFFTIATAYVFISWPASFLLKAMLKSFQFKQIEANESLQNAGQAIGILERILTLTFILISQYEVIGYLIAAKSLLRFREGNSHEPRIQTEYLIIGTLLSFMTSLLVGLSIKAFIAI